ncbi:hypothetical protein G6O67_008744 [Ophiocordyceps sinensis]|uniref:Uncharacterized protein n=1 Tax=Ophiocordyceps sinensis TaxID=72228 RepID=A0A8H4LRP5_9HYPO|nr:hypothetical protein G6O67_008744 [Ophiocordyceps sinensis]
MLGSLSTYRCYIYLLNERLAPRKRKTCSEETKDLLRGNERLAPRRGDGSKRSVICRQSLAPCAFFSGPIP